MKTLLHVLFVSSLLRIIISWFVENLSKHVYPVASQVKLAALCCIQCICFVKCVLASHFVIINISGQVAFLVV